MAESSFLERDLEHPRYPQWPPGSCSKAQKEQKVDCVSWVSTQLTSFRLELARIKQKNSVRDRSGQEVRESGACSWGRVRLDGIMAETLQRSTNTFKEESSPWRLGIQNLYLFLSESRI